MENKITIKVLTVSEVDINKFNKKSSDILNSNSNYCIEKKYSTVCNSKDEVVHNATFTITNIQDAIEFNTIVQIAKGLAAQKGIKTFDISYLFMAIGYVDIDENSFCYEVLSKMMGDSFFGIEKKDNGKYFIEKSKESKDIKYDENVNKFINEALKHFSNKKICFLR